ncbi:MAG: 2OG-Fe(II) oxygenase [Acidobacteriia bacterium]|nr:2OG-Fe(II) oxygenase [Terriglobia bacterium]
MSDASEPQSVRGDPAPPIAQRVLQKVKAYRENFLRAEPFRHVAIDGFFEPEFAEELLAGFPVFNPELAKNEIYGGVWGKAVNTRIREIGPVYRRLYEAIESRAFLGVIEEITGIPDLIFDPQLYGGGTHENLHGQDLDPHVDFNYDQAQRLHRRLNLIVYLNKGWRAEWGGALELHSNPRKPAENRIRAYNPGFNTAVLFETNEHSWHGFPRIELPPEERHRSRKSVSIYLYTRERPAEEVAPMHSTFYVQRPLPEWVEPGHVLSEEDCRYLVHAADRRDKWVEFYQNLELVKSGQVAEQAAYVQDLLNRVRAPLTGYVMQQGGSTGLYADGWTRRRIELKVQPLRPVTALRLRGWRADDAPESAEVTVRINGTEAAWMAVGRGVFELEATCEVPLAETFVMEAECDPEYRPAGDHRELAFVLMEIRAEHE